MTISTQPTMNVPQAMIFPKELNDYLTAQMDGAPVAQVDAKTEKFAR